MTRHPALSQTEHRPWQIPSRPWVLQQEWFDLLFIHWEISPDSIRHLIPAGLQIDTFDGTAWIAVVPFSMRGVAPRFCPQPSFISNFPEINVRTYVVKDGKPGVWFFSLDVPHRLPVWLARTLFHLPYFRAKMSVFKKQEQTHYRSKFSEREFSASYRGDGYIESKSGSFEHWATERYCLYSQSKSGQLYRAEVQHPKWPLQKAIFEVETNTMLAPFSARERHPSVLFSSQIPVIAWWPQRC